MNLILLSDADFITPNRVRLTGRRFEHIQGILKAECGQSLTIGKINGLMGQGTIISLSFPPPANNGECRLIRPKTFGGKLQRESGSLDIEVKLDQKPPDALPLTLILALPRPPMLKRILFSAAMLGVKKIIILNFNRVEKSLWNSSSLKPQAIEEQLILGLEQAKDTIMPEVILKKAFKPFVQDELPDLIKGNPALVAHPGGENSVISAKAGIQENGQLPIFLIIGPEGGIIDYEIDLLKTAGCQTIDLGPRILRTESVLPFLVGKFFKQSQKPVLGT